MDVSDFKFLPKYEQLPTNGFPRGELAEIVLKQEESYLHFWGAVVGLEDLGDDTYNLLFYTSINSPDGEDVSGCQGGEPKKVDITQIVKYERLNPIKDSFQKSVDKWDKLLG